MYPIALARPWKALLFLALAANVAGCGGGDSSDEAPVEEPFLTAQGQFLTGIYDPANEESVYLEGGITSRGRWSAFNLARWDTEPRDGEAANLPYTDPLDLYIRDTALGRLSYRAMRTAWGAIEPDGNVFFIAGPRQKVLMSARKPKADEDLVIDDLEGQFTCLRSFPSPQNRLQLLTATFTPGSSAVDFEVLTDTATNTLPAPYAGRYELDADGRFRITEDAGVPATPPAEKTAETEDEKERRESLEVLRGGAFQKQEQFLFASYLYADPEPTLAELVSEDTRRDPQEVHTDAFLACLKGGTAMTDASLNGEFWYAEIAARRETSDASFSYQQTYGHVLVNDVGSLSRVECKSSTALRRWEMSYQVTANGQLTAANDVLQLQGILNHDGSLALLMNKGDERGFSFDIWTKKPLSTGCPAD